MLFEAGVCAGPENTDLKIRAQKPEMGDLPKPETAFEASENRQNVSHFCALTAQPVFSGSKYFSGLEVRSLKKCVPLSLSPSPRIERVQMLFGASVRAGRFQL